MKKALPNVSLVLGGASSGKTAWAESLVSASGLRPVYVATAQALDDEMAEKIRRHRASRGEDWRTVECGAELARALSGTPEPGEVALVDCLTMWLTAVMFGEGDPDTATDALLSALASAAGPVVLVSNELGGGIVPADPLSRRFRDAQGRLNQRVAAMADMVVLVTAGLPLALKGRLPE